VDRIKGAEESQTLEHYRGDKEAKYVAVETENNNKNDSIYETGSREGHGNRMQEQYMKEMRQKLSAKLHTGYVVSTPITP